MVGEPWQNAVQRAGSQLRYESQVGGAKGRCTEKTDLCYVGRSGRCQLSGRGKRDPEHRAHPNVKAASARAKAFDFGGKRATPRAATVGSMKSVSAQRKRRGEKAKGTGPDLSAFDAEGGALYGGARGRKKGEHSATRRCAYNKPTARCRKVKGCQPKLKNEPELRREHMAALHAARVRRGTAGKGTAKGPWQKHLAAFRAAHPGHKNAMKAASETYHAKKDPTVARKVSKTTTLGGGWDGFSDTSSTRSSDFTSVSDTTSYSASTDSSSMW